MRPTHVLIALALTSALVAAQDEKYYGMSDVGRLAVNGTVLDKLPGSFDPDDEGGETNAEQAWVDMVVVGADRYALRADGLVRKNGGKLFNLPWTPIDPLYAALAVMGEEVWALRGDGLVMRDKKVYAEYPAEGFPFVDIEVVGGHVYALALDGAVFVDTEEQIVAFDMRGDPPTPGPLGGTDGLSFFTLWLDIEIAANGDVYALRSDGILTRAEEPVGGGDPTTTVANLWAIFPGPTPSFPLLQFSYTDIELDEAGVTATPVALRRDGQVYTAPVLLVDPLLQVDYAGDGLDADQIFTDLVIDFVDGFNAWAIRSDGRLYGDLVANDAILVFPKKGYVKAAVTTVAPDLSNFKNSRPVVGRYKARVLEGQAASIPITLTDSDKPADEILVTLFDDPAELDEGVTWNADDWSLELDDTLTKGSASLRIEVDDGESKPRRLRVRARVVPVDANPEKNKPPRLLKIKPLQALVGVPFELELLTFDPDGDEVTIAVDPGKKKSIFNLDVTDAELVEEDGKVLVRWTPQFDDLGNQIVRVTVTDGDKTKKGALKIRVVSPLIF